MPSNPGPFDLKTARPILGPEGRVTIKQVSANFYEELDTEFSGFGGHALIQTFEFEQAWPTWEMHPKGDEVVYLISGDVDFVLWTDDGETIVHMDKPGSYVVVPKGAWHTARPRKLTSMLFITPGEGTQNAETPGEPIRL